MKNIGWFAAFQPVYHQWYCRSECFAVHFCTTEKGLTASYREWWF